MQVRTCQSPYALTVGVADPDVVVVVGELVRVAATCTATQLSLSAMSTGRQEVCLKFPENLGIHAQITYEQAVTMLSKAVQLATQIPFVWSHIDKPAGERVY